MLREGEETIKTTKYFDFTSGWASVCVQVQSENLQKQETDLLKHF